MPTEGNSSPLRERIETAARASWPALEERWLDGWLLRFAGGYTRRSNSVYPLASPPGELEAQVTACEAAFNRQGLTPSFRMTGFQGPAPLDQLLARRGYEHVTPTFVLQRALADGAPAAAPAIDFERYSVERWIAAFAELSGTPTMRAAAHGAILAAVPEPRCLALAHAGGRPVACGVAVVVAGLCGIFDVVTAPAARRQGYGTALMAALLGWAQEQGAQVAYLQVLQTNRPALRLYERLAFGHCYDYWYRVLAPVPPPSDTRLGAAGRD
jgi:GNAT superfamily N-acetyltransferase